MSEPLYSQHFETAKAFLDALNINNQLWQASPNLWDSAWIFRGQRDSTWALLPSSRRNKNVRLRSLVGRKKAWIEEILSQSLTSRVTDAMPSDLDKRFIEKLAQDVAELEIIKEFVEIADRVGHPVPDADEVSFFDDQRIFTEIRKQINTRLKHENFSINDWFAGYGVNLPIHSKVVALAQHHGIPTKFLDWTTNPLVAAFFAGEEVEANKQSKGNIAVWAMRRDIVEMTYLKIIQPRRSDLNYLHAQSGLFVYIEEFSTNAIPNPHRVIAGTEFFMEHGRWPSFEDIVAEIINFSMDCKESWFRKLTLPQIEVGTLMKLLWQQGITRAHLMPTYDNVTKALEMKARWEEFN